MASPHRVLRLTPERLDEAVEVLSSAFTGYPAMRYILDPAPCGQGVGLRHLFGYFTDSRMSRGWPVLGVDLDGALAGAANVTPPGPASEIPALIERFEALCLALGPAAVERFRTFAEACNEMEPNEPHYYLGSIGVRPGFQGRGVGRALIEAVHELSRRDPASDGVALSTESPDNVALYEHLGYSVVAERRLDWLHTWTMFRPDQSVR
jgi:GNAT superfamily N-acetyltransferase